MVDLSGRIYSLCDYYLGTKADTDGEESIIIGSRHMNVYKVSDTVTDYLGFS